MLFVQSRPLFKDCICSKVSMICRRQIFKSTIDVESAKQINLHNSSIVSGWLGRTKTVGYDAFVSHALVLILKTLCYFIGSRVGSSVVVVVQAIDVTSMCQDLSMTFFISLKQYHYPLPPTDYFASPKNNDFLIANWKHPPRSHRRKRDLNNFIIPYTKWCGKGWNAKKYSDIGGFHKTGTWITSPSNCYLYNFATSD